MDPELIDDDTLSLARKSLLPGEGFFVPDELDEQREERAAERALSGAEVAVVADPDADGLACVALLREAYGAGPPPVPDDEEPAVDGTATGGGDGPANGDADGDREGADAPDGSEADTDGAAATGSGPDLGDDERPLAAGGVALLPVGPHDLEDGLARVAEYAEPGIDVFVCDLCPDRFEYVEEELAAAVEVADEVRWFDHHQWDADVAERVRAAGVDLVIGESDGECTADVTLRSLDHEFDARYRDLAAATRDHDLWIKEDPRSDDLADFSVWSDPAEYVATVMAHGADLPEETKAFLEERRVEKESLIERAADRAEYREVGPWTVGVTYGRCSQNEVAEAMREAGADASVIVKPAGSASIRGTDDFQRCHEVAGLVNGGGHPKAAGCKPEIYDDMLDFAHHWTTEGAVAKRTILDAFREVARDLDEGDSAGEPDEE